MSLAKKLDAAREQRRNNPGAVRLVRVDGAPVPEPVADVAPPASEDDTVLILEKAWIEPDPAPAPTTHENQRPGFFRRLATAGNRAFTVAFIVVAFTGSNIASYAAGNSDHQYRETKAKIALMAEADLHPPLKPLDWNRETGKPIKAPSAEFNWSATK